MPNCILFVLGITNWKLIWISVGNKDPIGGSQICTNECNTKYIMLNSQQMARLIMKRKDYFPRCCLCKLTRDECCAGPDVQVIINQKWQKSLICQQKQNICFLNYVKNLEKWFGEDLRFESFPPRVVSYSWCQFDKICWSDCSPEYIAG